MSINWKNDWEYLLTVQQVNSDIEGFKHIQVCFGEFEL